MSGKDRAATAAIGSMVMVLPLLMANVVATVISGSLLPLLAGALLACVAGGYAVRNVRVEFRKTPDQQRHEDIVWWQRAATEGTPAEQAIAPQMVAALGGVQLEEPRRPVAVRPPIEGPDPMDFARGRGFTREEIVAEAAVVHKRAHSLAKMRDELGSTYVRIAHNAELTRDGKRALRLRAQTLAYLIALHEHRENRRIVPGPVYDWRLDKREWPRL